MKLLRTTLPPCFPANSDEICATCGRNPFRGENSDIYHAGCIRGEVGAPGSMDGPQKMVFLWLEIRRAIASGVDGEDAVVEAVLPRIWDLFSREEIHDALRVGVKKNG